MATLHPGPPRGRTAPTFDPAAYRLSQDVWRRVFDVMEAPTFLHDAEGRLIEANQAYAQAAGLSREALLGRPYWEVFPRRSGPLPSCVALLEHASEQAAREDVTLGDGRIFASHAFAVRDAMGDYQYSLHIMHDVTGQRLATRALQDARERFELAIAATRDGLFDWDVRTGKTYFSPAWLEMLGCDVSEFGGNWRRLYERVHADDRPALKAAVRKALRSGARLELPRHRLRHHDGHWIWVRSRLLVVLDDKGRPQRVIGTSEDITELVEKEQALAMKGRRLELISEINRAIASLASARDMITAVTRLLVEKGGYALVRMQACALPGQADDLRMYARKPSLASGFPANRPFGPEQTGCTARARRVDLAAGDDTAAPDDGWRRVMAKHGLSAAYLQPVRRSRTSFGLLTLYTDNADLLDPDECDMLQQLADDLAVGLALWQASDRQQRALFQTITAIARTLEKRDPYTAGHQQRVAELAVAIGARLGLTRNEQVGLRLGGLIHDIGKIYVPAEILNRSGRLTPAEFELIKSHPQVGGDILADTDFPWPVRDMVMQHHEHIDGSGYPQGLCGDQIIREARILTVADVVEAISSHRPYRPARGVAAALREIRDGRGRRYDPEAVDACLTLFEQEGFRWNHEPDSPAAYPHPVAAGATQAGDQSSRSS